MDHERFDAWSRRRFAAAAGGLAGALFGVARAEDGAAKKKNLCKANGARCTKAGKRCTAEFCLNAPFKVEANTDDNAIRHDAYLFVPRQNAGTGPGPYLNFACNETNSDCASKYPFACVDQESPNTGDGVTTIHKLLPGRYEYWIQLQDNTAAGELTIVLRDKGGRVVRRWENPVNQTGDQLAWHVFDVDGKHGSVASVDETVAANLPPAAHDPFTFVCAF